MQNFVLCVLLTLCQSLLWFCRYKQPVKGRKINWMKAGILESDRVVTVSPYYAQELVSGVEKGVELDNILRVTGITGIVNGMDAQEWNPSTDKYIDVKYNATTVSLWVQILRRDIPVSMISTLSYLDDMYQKFQISGDGCETHFERSPTSRSWAPCW